ncbi:MAG: flagellar basal body rod protein FlgB [Deltaproteobacteria bacterium]|nr:flagellar basal body rod protein FlgB [Deltaproteobacteria bacterium]
MQTKGLFDTTTDLLGANLDRRAVAHRLTARNLANIDTPHFRGTGLEFEKQLRKALDGDILPATMSKTDPRHFPEKEAEAFDKAKPDYMDTGAVHLDIEMSKLAENNIMFNAMVQLLGKKYSILKSAISEGQGGK